MRVKMRLWKRLILSVVAIILVVIVALTVFFFDTLRTAFSLKKISNKPAYQMTYYGDYALDEYIRKGAASDDQLRSFLVDNLAGGSASLMYRDHGCSAFFAVTPDGDKILARNFDTADGLGCVLETDNTEGSRILGMSNIGWVMEKADEDISFMDRFNFLASPYVITDGINEYGLGVAAFTAKGSSSGIDESRVTIFDQTTLCVLLNKAKDVDDAISVLSRFNVKMTSSFPSHYMVCDESGSSAVIEFVDGKMQTVNRTESYQICSNFVLFENPSFSGFGSDRYMNYESVLSQTGGVISTEDALKLLQANTIPGDEQWSVVYNLTDKTASVTFFGDYDTVHKYSL